MADCGSLWKLVAGASARLGDECAGGRPSEAEFVTELMVSELVTNTIRYADGPIRLSLIRDEVLVCDVSDGSSTPHLRRARDYDEGGRGLFLVARLTQRWGTRYTRTGKTVWAERPIATRSGHDASAL